MPGPRLRFSLLNALLMMTIFAMGLALWRAYTELAPLREELRVLRNEAGYLTVEDPSRLHAASTRRADPLAWSWRFYLPRDRDYRLCCSIGDFPNAGELLQKTRNTYELTCAPAKYRTDGHRLGTVAMYRNVAGDLELKLTFWGKTSKHVLNETQARLLETSERDVFLEGVGGCTSAEPGEPLVLLKKEFLAYRNTASPYYALNRGVLIWVEEASNGAASNGATQPNGKKIRQSP